MIAVLIRTLGPSHRSPARLLVALHEALSGSLQAGTFVTMFYGILDPSTGQLTYASAGHNPVLRYRASHGDVERLDSRGIPIGLIPGDALRESLDDLTVQVDPGDVVVQYTDGFHEAVNPAGEEFGLERMIDLIATAAGDDSVLASMQRAVDCWEGAQPSSDDKTILVLSRSAGEGAAERTTESRGERDHLAELWSRRSVSRNHFVMPATLEALDRIGVWLRRCAFIKDLAAADLGAIEQGLYEVGANIVEHGYSLEGGGTIDVWWIPDAVPEGGVEAFTGGYFLVRDHGRPPRPDAWQGAFDIHKVRTEGRGLGLRIINRTFAGVELHPATGMGNVSVLRYRQDKTQPAQEVSS
jgi:anti-sigma regulatory factor (Ser/Thr protein kinase)